MAGGSDREALAVYRTGRRHDLEVVGVTSPGARHAGTRREYSALHDAVSHYPNEISLVIKTHDTAERMAPGIKLAVDAAHGGRAAFEHNGR